MEKNSPNSNAQFVREAPGSYRVNGNLDFDTARDLLKQSAAAMTEDRDLAIDLSRVATADSAGLALLVEWYRLAARRDQKLRFVGVPAQLRALAEISDLDSVLPFA